MCSAWDVRGSLTQVSLFGNLRVLTSAHDSPKLIAVYYVLHRHLTPRHPPYALSSFLKHDAEKLKFVSRLLHFFIHYFITIITLFSWKSANFESDRTEVVYSFPVNDLNSCQEH